MSQAAITAEPAVRQVSLDQWAAMLEDEPGELLDGALVEEEVADALHEIVVSFLLYLLTGWARPRKGTVFGSELKVAVGPRRGRKPDISVFLAGGQRFPRRGVVRAPPDIIVEVVSPTPRDGRRDRVEKLGEYAKFGVRWYWIIDPTLRTVEILMLDAERRYTHVADAASGLVEVPGCEGLTLDVDDLWREVDEKMEEEPQEPTG